MTALLTSPLFDWLNYCCQFRLFYDAKLCIHGLPLGFWGLDLANKSVRLIDEGKTKFMASNRKQVGRTLVGILSHPTNTVNRFSSAESFTTTQIEFLDALGKVTGFHWEVSNCSTDEIKAVAMKLFDEGNVTKGGLETNWSSCL